VKVLEGEQKMPGRPTLALWKKVKPVVRQMRHAPTPAEAELWKHLRSGILKGLKFRRQHPISQFVVDFYCHKAFLVIEVYGAIHQDTQEDDALRQTLLESLGLRILRFTNDQVFNHLEHVLQIIEQAALGLTTEITSPSPKNLERGIEGVRLNHGSDAG
jgi:very-short-patch-repair endonuclease